MARSIGSTWHQRSIASLPVLPWMSCMIRLGNVSPGRRGCSVNAMRLYCEIRHTAPVRSEGRRVEIPVEVAVEVTVTGAGVGVGAGMGAVAVAVAVAVDGGRWCLLRVNLSLGRPTGKVRRDFWGHKVPMSWTRARDPQ